MKIPLSLLQLSHEKMRLLVAIAGITFADVLMFMQLGFQEALLNSAVRLHKSLQGDVFVMNSQSDTLMSLQPFSQRRLYEIMGVSGVKSARPIYVGLGQWKNPVTKQKRTIYVLGINPVENLINLPGVPENLKKLKQEDTVLFDQQGRSDFGPVPEMFNQGKPVITEVANRRIRVGGLFDLGASFGADGNLITSDVNFFRIFPDRKKGLVELGVIKLKPGVDKAAVTQQIRSILSSSDVKVYTKQELIKHEKSYWQNRTAIGFIFTLGTIMGFIVGTVIVYQILYTDVADHLPEYATLKAMGYTDKYLLMVVFQEAIILGCIGFIPGFSLSLLMYARTLAVTRLPIMMTLTRAVTVFVLTLVMCWVSGVIAVGKLRAADPADIFG
jgi:putative ABC transport system permease protein